MKLILVIVLAILSAAVKASIIPANPITTTYALPHAPVATSYQVVARNVNRVLVPQVPAITTSAVAYPGYATTWGGYPYNYRGYYGYGYGGHVHNYGYGYGYGYPYGYGASVW